MLKIHLPYHDSDHVLNIAYNLLAGGTCLEHLELRRNDEAYLDALGARRVPDPTTAGDFCRRFDTADIFRLQAIFNATRLKVWRQQPKTFFEEAIIDADGTMVETTGECKQGMDINYKGQWGYHALVLSLANTGEPLFVVNRSGNRPSHEQAAVYFDRAIALCRQAGFQKIRLRGDTDFTQTEHLDRWDARRRAVHLRHRRHEAALRTRRRICRQTPGKRCVRPAKYEVKTQPRRRPENVKQQVVEAREFEDIRLVKEHVAEFRYRPAKCQKAYRVVVVWKELEVYQGQKQLFDDARCFFYITNDEEKPAEEIVFEANDRCNQENLLAQLKGGVRSLTAPVDNLVSNWAYMVMGSLAWSLKAWAALMLPERRPLAGEAPGGETQTAADGLRHVSAGDDERSGADRLDGAEDCLSAVGVESLAARLLPSAWTSFVSRCVVEGTALKPESGCSGPFSPPTALCATESDMKHDTTRNLSPGSVASAARGVARLRCEKITPNAFGVRLFKD